MDPWSALLPGRFFPIRITKYSNGPRWTCAFVAVVRKSDRLPFVRGCTTPAPALPRYVCATSFANAGLALIAAMTCAAVLVGWFVASVARLTLRSLPVNVTVSGEFGTPGLHELGREVVAALVAPRPRREDDGLRLRGCRCGP